jgi:hypothetical protein
MGFAAIVDREIEHAIGTNAAVAMAPEPGELGRHPRVHHDDEIVFAGLIF